ncbi:hypothetical protein ACGFZK_18695 [Streptomyces sp. NPDC048257]|uniref:hypothetical protein n=1 Tax=Streptomyces sp. NPDC048257 TaxID=3365526 RepID=UPI00371A9FDC
MAPDIALRFERVRTKGSHNDLRLRLGSYRHTCDSYYLAIDNSPTAFGGLGPRLSRLLEQWAAQVEALTGTGGTAYLPYDFSDQCTAWLRVSSSDGRGAEVHAGWSRIEAWGLTPSDYLATAPRVQDFAPIPGAHIHCSLSALAAHINTTRPTLTATGP